MRMIATSLSKVGYLTLVLLIVLVIFAMAGMQTIGTLYHLDNKTVCVFFSTENASNFLFGPATPSVAFLLLK